MPTLLSKNWTALAIWITLALSTAHGQNLPKLIPPSPEASALFKYADYPVDYSTGVPSVSIPLFQIQSGSLSLPLSLSYHASGRRVTDQTGPVGLGWTLNAGGMVSRTVNGSPDFNTSNDNLSPFPYPYKLSSDLSSPKTEADYDYLTALEHYQKATDWGGQGHSTWRDAEYDVFSYSLNGSSGKFIFKDNNGVKTPMFIPDKPMAIAWDNAGLSYIHITDDKGVVYQFGSSEYYDSGTNYNSVSGWSLRQIISADKADTISFIYGIGFHRNHQSVSQQYTLIDNWNWANGDAGPPPTDPLSWSESPINIPKGYTLTRLTEIRFKQGKVVFNLYPAQPTGSTLYEDMVSHIQIFNRQNEVIKTIAFSQTTLNRFQDVSQPVNKLDQLQMKDKAGQVVETYGFEYNPVAFPTSDPAMNARQCDWWGYYNASGDNMMVPPFTVAFYEKWSNGIQTFGSGGNREPNLLGAQSGVLKKITYPTGGSTEFTYGLNKYYDPAISYTKSAGGLRIQQIKTNDGQGHTYYKTYAYGTNENDWGLIALTPSLNTTSYESQYMNFGFGGLIPNGGSSFRERVFTSSFLPSLSYLAEKPIVYPQVTEYHGTPGNNSGKTVYTYESFVQSPQGMLYGSTGGELYRTHVTEYNDWAFNALTDQDDYERVVSAGVATYKLRKHLHQTYQNIATGATGEALGLHSQRVYIFPQTGYVNAINLYVDKWASVFWNNHTQVYAYANYRITTGTKNLIQSDETTYTDDNTPFTSTTSYSYNSRQLLSKTQKTGANNDLLITENKYPFDLASASDANYLVHQQMMSQNMLNYVIEQHEFRNTTPLRSVQTAYRQWNSNRWAPEIVSTRMGTAAYDPRVVYQAYDASGNVQQVAKAKDVPLVYLWGYNNTYPIAEVKNATLGATEETTALTSFTRTIPNTQYAAFTAIASPNTITLDHALTLNFSVQVTKVNASAAAPGFVLALKDSQGAIRFSQSYLPSASPVVNSLSLPAGVYTVCYTYNNATITVNPSLSVTLSAKRNPPAGVPYQL